MGLKFGTEEGSEGPLLRAKYQPHRCNAPVISPPFIAPSFPFSILLTALGVLRMLLVLQRFGDAYGF